MNKLWNKEINENEGVQEVEYKVLDKRFYFLKSQDYTFLSPVTIGSEALIESTTATTAPIESYSGVSYNEVVTNYYGQIGNIISTANITTAEFNLNSTDIATFDFKKQYFIEQLGSVFLVNKINNWRPNDLCDVELIKVDNDMRSQMIAMTDGVARLRLLCEHMENRMGMNAVSSKENIQIGLLATSFIDFDKVIFFINYRLK